MKLFELFDHEYGSNVGVPPAKPVPLPHLDARTNALRTFKAWLATLIFNRTGASGEEPVSFRVPEKAIHVEQPDDVTKMVFPSIAFVSQQEGRYESYGIGPAQLDESSRDVFAPGTALLQVAEWVEPLGVDLWGSKRAERRALVAGFEVAMGGFEESNSVRLRMPQYFDRMATFSLQSGMLDETEAVRNRRKAKRTVLINVPVVRLVRVNDLQPFVSVTTLDAVESL